MKNKYNLLVKRNKEKAYLINDFIATKLSEKEFEKTKELNPKLLGDYDFMPFSDTDFGFWNRVDKYLTKTKLTKNVAFEIDYYGNVTKY